MDRSKALTIIPRNIIARIAEAESDVEILAMLTPGLGTLSHDGLRQVEFRAVIAIQLRYPDNPRDPLDLNGWRRQRHCRFVREAIDKAERKLMEGLADGAKRVRKAQIDYYAARAELRAYQEERTLILLKAKDKAEATAQELLAEDGAHQAAMALARQEHNHAAALRQLEQPHEIALKKEEQVVPLEVTRMKTATEVEVVKVQARTEIQVATVKGYNEAQVAGFRSLITLLSAEKDPVKLGELFTDFLAAAAIIDQEREMHSPLYTTTTDQATGATITEMNTAEARYRSQAKHDDLRRIVDTWQKTIARGA
jgi:hypothetical protein